MVVTLIIAGQAIGLVGQSLINSAEHLPVAQRIPVLVMLPNIRTFMGVEHVLVTVVVAVKH